MIRFSLKTLLRCGLPMVLPTGIAGALEYPAGQPQIAAGMEVAAVYLQPIEMDPPGMMRDAAESDIHLEADIHAMAENADGFADGEWVPHLEIAYELTGPNGDKAQGPLMPMVASDGPHYGDNVKLFGPGRYQLKFIVAPPGPASHFGRHVDRETGVGSWFEAFTVEYEFVFAGTGKKGAY